MTEKPDLTTRETILQTFVYASCTHLARTVLRIFSCGRRLKPEGETSVGGRRHRAELDAQRLGHLES